MEERQRDALKPSGREARKRAEKHRRTVLNSLVSELTQLVPLVGESARKVDKTGVLRLAAHEIRKEHVFGEALSRQKRPHDITYDVAEAFFDLFDGFLLTMTTRGLVVVASPNVYMYLGYAQIDLLGSSVFALVHPDDAASLDANLTPSSSPPPSPGAAAPERRDFVVRLARAGAKQEPVKYAACRFRGGFRRADRAVSASDGRSGERTVARRQRVRKERLADPAGNDVVMVALVNVLRKPTVSAKLLEVNSEEYWTRHLVDGRIVHCDQRISLVAGYMSEEVTGVSAFTFMHKEDVRWVIIALRQMYDQNQPYGESCYRLVSRTGRFMYLRTRGYLEVDPDTKIAQSFVCINSMVPDEEGNRMISDMKKRYSAIVDIADGESLQTENCGDPALEDPKELEQVIMCLIDNLPSTESSPQSSPSCVQNSLTIIPPEPTTIKPSIQKSLSVVSMSTLKRGASESYNSNSSKRPNLSSDDSN